MDRVRELLETLKKSDQARGNFVGLLHILIGRHVTRSDGTPVSQGLTWRELAEYLKKVRWPKEAAAELGLDRSRLPPRDRVRYWYQAIARSRVDSAAAAQSGNELASRLSKLGYLVSASSSPSTEPQPNRASAHQPGEDANDAPQ